MGKSLDFKEKMINGSCILDQTRTWITVNIKGQLKVRLFYLISKSFMKLFLHIGKYVDILELFFQFII